MYTFYLKKKKMTLIYSYPVYNNFRTTRNSNTKHLDLSICISHYQGKIDHLCPINFQHTFYNIRQIIKDMLLKNIRYNFI